MRVLAMASQKLGEKMYADAGTAQGAPAGGGGGTEKGKTADEGDVVDAEFEEVKDKK